MSNNLILRLARKIKIPFIRKGLLRFLFKKNGLHLQQLYSFNHDKFFIYQVNNHFIPNEALTTFISYETQSDKCRNESLFAYQPQEGDTIIDLGAGLGEETLYYSHLVGHTGKVISVEANPAVFEVLQKTITLNGLSNVSSFNMAVFSDNGTTSLSVNDPSYEAAFITKDTKKAINIPASRMDSFLEKQKIEKISLLKANIEGAERYIIDTLTAQQVSKIRHIAIACHDFRYLREGNDFYKTKKLVIDFFTKNGFEISTRQTGIDYLDDWVFGTNKL
ncbi:MAG TPA: FkbM family methyltransferase [Chitinophagaceae bacterium]|nr:FkbM family methyltransferase [Chitinophagaceae bacterium]HQV86373.1 FkbM family methyltransferase [Chitinophagaceae bacterium]HQX74211.1 FkbM family methyltransferase [Chitinophagaceae bacterium]HQZ75327.1 FkbM family methyltransferase [Chitinophagaceae bacterium]